MKNKIKITIGITCYNAEASIGKCLDSALAQNYDNLEILVVDDYSTDQSISVIESYLQNDSRVRLIRHERNKGCASARNTLVEHAKGEFIAFFDDDDESLPIRLITQLKAILNKEVQYQTQNICCYSSSIKIYQNGYQDRKPAIGTQGKEPFGISIFNFIFLGEKGDFFWGDGTPTSTLMCRTSLLKAIGKFDEKLRRVEDLDMAIRAGINQSHFVGTSEYLVHRYHSDGADKAENINSEAEIYLIKKYKSRLGRDYLKALLWFKIRRSYFNKRYYSLLLNSFLFCLISPKSALKKTFSTVPRRIAHEIRMKI